MDRKTIVIADMDAEYIRALEYRFLDGWEEELELEIITDRAYLREYLSQPHEIGLLVMTENLYTEAVQKQNCGRIVLLTESEAAQETDPTDSGIMRVYKFSSAAQIYSALMRGLRTDDSARGKEGRTRLYASYAVCGGCGKTIATLGVAQALEDLGSRVLYINMEGMQDFACFLPDEEYAGASFGYSLASQDERLPAFVEREIRRTSFSYLRPLEKLTLAYQIRNPDWLHLVQVVLAKNRYDAVLLELPRETDDMVLELIRMADRVMLITDQREQSAYRLERFLNAVTRTADGWTVICNRYNRREENGLENALSLGLFDVAEYVPEQEDGGLTLQRIEEKGYFRAAAGALE